MDNRLKNLTKKIIIRSAVAMLICLCGYFLVNALNNDDELDTRIESYEELLSDVAKLENINEADLTEEQAFLLSRDYIYAPSSDIVTYEFSYMYYSYVYFLSNYQVVVPEEYQTEEYKNLQQYLNSISFNSIITDDVNEAFERLREENSTPLEGYEDIYVSDIIINGLLVQKRYEYIYDDEYISVKYPIWIVENLSPTQTAENLVPIKIPIRS